MSTINLLPWREHKRRYHRQRCILLLTCAVLFGYLISALIERYLAAEMTRQLQRLDYLQHAISEQRQKVNRLSDVMTQYEEFDDRLEYIKTLQLKRSKTTAVMNLIPMLVPQGVYIDKIRMRGDRFKLSGISENTALLAQMLERFERELAVTYVEMHSIVHDRQRFNNSYQAFELSFQVSLNRLLPEMTPRNDPKKGGSQ
ncbi:Fimbrial assembly protein (PilN) [Vibrio thalassae]|uniref:Fimbrial assembly protein (PilN) n=1 Tax=Vibrio thalassae TaxID=1243014 RepID=A0A240EMG1_9VIBR|nr:PilN domain-containing protein [Vibrio thalassae]SNX49804.1 Fimbrial assembly protein (PilN) [Vibrio thalassae]